MCFTSYSYLDFVDVTQDNILLKQIIWFWLELLCTLVQIAGFGA